MEMFRDVNGFSLRARHYVRVRFTIVDGVRMAAIYEDDDPFATFIQPLHDSDLYQVAYKIASQSARYEFHPHG